MSDLADYAWLTGADAARWLAAASLEGESELRRINRLRKDLSPARVRLVVEQIALRARATAKFGSLAEKMFFSDVALQQATDRWVAKYKAERLSSRGNVIDYCCGIGGDLLAFAECGPVTGWDRSEVMATLARANAEAAGCAESIDVCVGDVATETPKPGLLWHLDPDRRVDGRRSTQPILHSPGPQVVERWLQTSPSGALKLAPAADVLDEWQRRAELEWISRDRQCRQLVVWFGALASETGKRCATRVVPWEDGKRWSSQSFVGVADVSPDQVNRIDEFVYDTDPAIRAARLTGAIAAVQGLASLTGGASYLTNDRHVEHPLLTGFRVRDLLPLRVGQLGKHLRKLSIGQLEIKKRGVDASPEQLRKQLKLRGSESATLLLTRLGDREVAILADRIDAEGSAASPND